MVSWITWLERRNTVKARRRQHYKWEATNAMKTVIITKKLPSRAKPTAKIVNGFGIVAELMTPWINLSILLPYGGTPPSASPTHQKKITYPCKESFHHRDVPQVPQFDTVWPATKVGRRPPKLSLRSSVKPGIRAPHCLSSHTAVDPAANSPLAVGCFRKEMSWVEGLER